MKHSGGFKHFTKVTSPLGSGAQACRFKSCRAHHSEMTFGCQAAAQGAPASTAKVFLRLNLQSLRWIASLFLIKPSLTCSVAPPLQNANILLVCILVFLPTLENSRTPCLFVHFTKGRVSVFDVRIACIFLLYRTSRRQYIGKQHGFQEKN